MYSIPKPKIPNLKQEIKRDQKVDKPKFGLWTLEDQMK